MHLVTPALFNPRVHSLARANLLVFGSLLLAMPLSGIPRLHPAPLLIIPTLLASVGTADTLRCIRRRWCLYHGGVILCIYMDLMALSMLLFLLLYPYLLPFSSVH